MNVKVLARQAGKRRGISNLMLAFVIAIAFLCGSEFSGILQCGGVTGADPATSQYLFGTTAPVAIGVDIANVQEAVTVCIPITLNQKAALQKEIKDYEASEKFMLKIDEVKGLDRENPHDISIDKYRVNPHHISIDKYLREKVLQPDWSILELGCAAGMMLRMVKQAYDDVNIAHKELIGVELVTGWVTFAQSYHKDIKVYEGEHAAIRMNESCRNAW
jgi:hypothetical protein